MFVTILFLSKPTLIHPCYLQFALPYPHSRSDMKNLNTFSSAEIYVHNHSHIFPCKAANLDVYEAFLRNCIQHEEGSEEACFPASECQQDELEAVSAIFGDDVIGYNLQPPMVHVGLSEIDALVSVKIHLPKDCPDEALPRVEVKG
eukprot:768232-Hanusia_phi.AAC.5